MTLFLVRHGRPLVDPAVPAARWELDPAGFDDVWALRDVLPAGAAWYSSPEPKALQTAELLTDSTVGVVEGLAEQRRGATWLGNGFPVAVRRALREPDRPAVEGWEPAADCRARVVAAVRPLLAAHGGEDVVLVGHATAWTLLHAELTAGPGGVPDPAFREALAMPDVVTLDVATGGVAW